MPFQIRNQESALKIVRASTTLMTFFLSGCLAMAPKPGGYTERVVPNRLVVNESFQFTMVTGVFKAKTPIKIPKGVYLEIAADANGEYFLAPGGKIPAKLIVWDYYRGGIYRRHDSPPRYFVFSLPITEMDLWTRGVYPVIVAEIPVSFATRIQSPTKR